MIFLRVHELVKRIKGASVVSAVSFTQQAKERLAIAGETGSGKSTLLRMIAGLVQPDDGAVFFNNEKIKGPLEKLLPGHPAIAYLSQHFELPHYLKVGQVLEYASLLTKNETELVGELCDINHLLRRRTDELSGGETQRVALAKLIVARPSLLLLDEPYSNLDLLHKNILKQVVHDLEDQLGLTCMLVSHDPLDTLSWADTLMVMKDGVIKQTGTPSFIYRQPTDEYIAGLFGRFMKPDQSARTEFGIGTGEKRVFFRPDDFVLAGQGVPGRVNATYYAGSFTEVEIDTAEMKLWLQVQQEIPKKGELVYVQFRA